MTVSTEKARRASVTDIVPMADERRPEKGTLETSGEAHGQRFWAVEHRLGIVGMRCVERAVGRTYQASVHIVR